MIELLHSMHLYEPDMEIIRSALLIAQRMFPDKASLSLDYFTLTELQIRIGKRCMLSESDLIIIANGLVLLDEHPEYRFQGQKHTAFESVAHRFQKHLGRTFIG